MSGYIPVEELDVYRVAEEIADSVWDMVMGWNNFAKDAVGKQLVRAADSIGANIAEGCGDEGPTETRRYLRYARRSYRETRFFLRRAHQRSLIPEDQSKSLPSLIERMGRLLTAFTRSVNDQIKAKSRRKAQ